ncbi:MAG: pyridine nucleotide-disulfide oxidoreductase [Peptococcaceae bacterium BICA1-7]|nr:MAG: pyridine nucleotide-disulfide oxidoreductase [Peptococcaceae bacterium BICA1-7]HBV96824.1 pyridine nucleotide-disulfide oxidoreductase [Desulfotomaculum sp.]
MSEARIVIIGGVAAGPKTAARARRLAPNADITIIEKDSYISYAGCGMPFYLAGSVREFEHLFSTSYGVARDESYFMREKGVKVLTGNEAVEIDREKKEVLARNVTTGELSRIPYDKLVIATGATPFTPPLEGVDLKGVYRLNNPADAKMIKERIDDVSEAVVIGAGLIGMEAADALREKKIFVTVVELRDQILPGMLDSDMAAVMALRLEEQGIEFRLGHKVMKIQGDDQGRVSSVVTSEETLDAQMVILAVGVKPNIDIAKKAGLKIGQTGAIEVNQHLQTSDPDIFAVGDCAENTHLVSGRKVYIPMATYANRHGRVAGDNVTGRKSTFKGVLGTSVMKVLNWSAGKTGLGEQQARELGLKVISVVNSALDRTHYHPSHGLVIMKMIVDEDTRKILGAQGIGPGEVSKRIDVVATAIHFGATVDDLAEVDLGYAPPFSTPIDLAHHTANIARNKIEGLAPSITAAEMKAKLDGGEDFVIVDVRTPQQFAPKHIEDDRVMQVTLGDIRERLDDIPRNKEIVLLCAMGVRSYEALRILHGAGFKELKYMEGGLQAWPYDLD